MHSGILEGQADYTVSSLFFHLFFSFLILSIIRNQDPSSDMPSSTWKRWMWWTWCCYQEESLVIPASRYDFMSSFFFFISLSLWYCPPLQTLSMLEKGTNTDWDWVYYFVEEQDKKWTIVGFVTLYLEPLYLGFPRELSQAQVEAVNCLSLLKSK